MVELLPSIKSVPFSEIKIGHLFAAQPNDATRFYIRVEPSAPGETMAAIDLGPLSKENLQNYAAFNADDGVLNFGADWSIGVKPDSIKFYPRGEEPLNSLFIGPNGPAVIPVRASPSGKVRYFSFAGSKLNYDRPMDVYAAFMTWTIYLRGIDGPVSWVTVSSSIGA